MISTCRLIADGKMSEEKTGSYRLIGVRSVVQLYPGPFCYLVARRAVRRSRGCHFVILHPHVVRCVVHSCSGFESSPGRQGLLHGRRVSPLVASQHRLRTLPTSQCAEVLERGGLHFHRKLPPETMQPRPNSVGSLASSCPCCHQSRSKCREIGFAGSDGAGNTHSLIIDCDRRAVWIGMIIVAEILFVKKICAI